MKTKLFAASVLATLFVASTAFAVQTSGRQQAKGIEGPDVRLSTEGSQSTQPIKGTEGPDTRLVA